MFARSDVKLNASYLVKKILLISLLVPVSMFNSTLLVELSTKFMKISLILRNVLKLVMLQ